MQDVIHAFEIMTVKRKIYTMIFALTLRQTKNCYNRLRDKLPVRIKAGLEMPIKEWRALSLLGNRNRIQGTQEESCEKYHNFYVWDVLLLE